MVIKKKKRSSYLTHDAPLINAILPNSIDKKIFDYLTPNELCNLINTSKTQYAMFNKILGERKLLFAVVLGQLDRVMSKMNTNTSDLLNSTLAIFT